MFHRALRNRKITGGTPLYRGEAQCGPEQIPSAIARTPHGNIGTAVAIVVGGHRISKSERGSSEISDDSHGWSVSVASFSVSDGAVAQIIQIQNLILNLVHYPVI